MRCIYGACLVVLALVAGIVPAAAPPAPAPKAVVKQPPEPPIIPVSLTVDVNPVPANSFVTVAVNVEPGDRVEWEIDPPPVKQEPCGDGKLMFSGTPGTEYEVEVVVINFDTRRYGRKKDKVTFAGVKPIDPVTPPGPKPPTPPNPDKPQKVSRFILIENVDAAQPWRGTLFGDRTIQDYYRAAGLTHRILTTRAEGPDGDLDAEAKKYLELARGKTLPYGWVFDDRKALIREGEVPKTPDTFLAFIQPTPEDRAMGNLEITEPRERKHEWKKFGAHPNVPLIPRAQWRETDLSNFLPPVKDQDGQGSCNAYAAVTALQACREQAGLPPLRLSCGFVYGNINGGVDRGSYLEDALEFLTATGTCREDIIDDFDWRGGRRRPQNALADAKNYRIVEAYECPNFDAIASAIQQGFFCDVGLTWPANDRLDAEGWLPTGRGRGGHAVCAYGLAKRGNSWGIKIRNSWGAGWGKSGNCIIPESYFNRNGGYWAVRSATQTPDAAQTRRSFDLFREFALAF